ncbi:hypothetical protein KUTeg_005293 [Tegillarca granosa]|uniref:Pre-mRNA-splicing factor SLU7 n=1 Tax=Tegillarca granosa TaxID=220873 RepID=A0ABQ9FJD8_TEGGR|nr:hypothetical protein KUTeg_005293 [Tegillarca granosa]
MSFTLNLPPSVVAKEAKSEKDEPQKQSREDWRKQKELEEMRKAGTAPAMQDEEGKDINPHIPQYIMQAPWYYNATAATLKHQRIQEENQKQFNKLGEWYKKGIKEGSVATKYRKGACENCGAMTHKKKDCLERPRKIGAKFTGDNIAPDEHLQPNLSFDYDVKRDRWNGYNVDDHQEILDEHFSRIEEAKQMLKAENLEKSIQNIEHEEKNDDEEDEDKYADDVAMPGQKFETKQRITVRNLRIREDTAKLHVSKYFCIKRMVFIFYASHYFEKAKDDSRVKFAGDNFVRVTGDATEFATKQVFAWNAHERGTDVHLQADPTKLELLAKEVEKRKEDFKTSAKDVILAKYGGEEHLEAPPKQLLLAQTENYVEYSRHGRIIKGQEKTVIRSRYEEDVYLNNHTSVWGSYWKSGKWGYRCCHSLIKESYCTGEAGKEAAQNDLLSIQEGQGQEDEEEEEPKSLLEQHQEKLLKKKDKKKKKKKKKHKKRNSSSDSSESEDEEKIKERKLKKALKKEEENQKRADELLAMDERKRPYNSMYEAHVPTEEEMEAWRLKQRRIEDPLTFM